jgi:hypothetical protein
MCDTPMRVLRMSGYAPDLRPKTHFALLADRENADIIALNRKSEQGDVS